MTNPADLINRLSSGRILVVGDLMLDCFVSGEISRISPEAPIPVLRKKQEDFALGGAGNVVRNLRSLGCKVAFVSCVGEDAGGQRVRQLLDELGSVHLDLLSEPGRATTVKTRFVADRQQVLRVDAECAGPIGQELAAGVVKSVKRRLPDCRLLLLSDYGKGLLTGSVLEDVISTAQDFGCPVFVDPKGSDYSRYRGATLVTPNRRELFEATGLETNGEQDVERAARLLMKKCGVEAVLATRGAAGMSLIRGGCAAARLPAQAREVFDVSGAGDTVIAVAAAAVAVGAGLEDACALANLAAGVVVGKVGTATVRPDDLIRSAHLRDVSRAEAKVLSDESLLELVGRWRREGRSVGFTNGVFDLLHRGHLSLLQQAAEQCDRLIIGLNGDSSVLKITGHPPVQNEATRSAILASFEQAAAVVVFQEETPIPILSRVKPDVLIKGSNYDLDEVVGAQLVRSYGGKVFLAEISDIPAPDSAIARATNGSF